MRKRHIKKETEVISVLIACSKRNTTISKSDIDICELVGEYSNWHSGAESHNHRITEWYGLEGTSV